MNMYTDPTIFTSIESTQEKYIPDKRSRAK